MQQIELSPHLLRAVAVEAGCDPRTVARALRGESYSTTTARVLAALSKLGLYPDQFKTQPEAQP